MRRYEQAKRGLDGRALFTRLAAVAGVCLFLRAVAAEPEAGPAAARFPEGLGRFILASELPGTDIEVPSPGLLALASELPGFSLSPADASPRRPDYTVPDKDPPARGGDETDGGDALSGVSPPDRPATDGAGASGGDRLPEAPVPPPVGDEEPEMDAIGTTITGSGGGYTGAGEGIYFKNDTDYPIDVEAALSAPLPFGADAAVLIIHTHGSEAYNPTEEDPYAASDPSRTEDLNYNMIRVGDELVRVLQARGVTAYHDRSIYDYPSYTGSYDRSLRGAEEFVAQHPEIKVIIDLHRDALEGDGVLYKTVADVGDAPCAQVMVICGTDAAGIQPEPDWHINLGVAVKLQSLMNDKYPTLARPMRISQYRYNQNVAPGGLLVEVGTNGNTLREAIRAAMYFGECLAELILNSN